MLGALTPWLEREFLSQRNQHGDALPNSPLVDPKRVQLITATGTTTENGEELVWTEVADGEFWIHCCFPRDLVNHFDSSSARAKPFSSYSATKGLFRLCRYRFVLARPLIPPHASPRKQHPPQKEQSPRLRSLRICLRVDEFKLYSQGQGSLLGDYQDFRKWCPVAPAPPGGEATSEPVAGAAAKARVEWVKRIECGHDSSKEKQKEEVDPGAASKVEFLQDLQGTSDPKPRFRKPSPPPAVTASTANPTLAAPLFPPIASTSNTDPPPPPLLPLAPPTSPLPRHRPIPSVRDGVPAYVPTATWPADAQMIVKIDWRAGEERIQERAMALPPPPPVVSETKKEEEEEKVVVPLEQQRGARDARRRPPDKEEDAEVEMLLLGGAGSKPNSPTKETTTATETATETAKTTRPIKVDWSSAAETLQRRQQQQQQQQQQSETRAAAVQARPSKPLTATMAAPSMSSSSPSRRPANPRQNTATSSPVMESRTDPTRARARSRISPQQQRAGAGIDVETGSRTAGEAVAAAMREEYEAAWRLVKNGPDGPPAGLVGNDGSNRTTTALDFAAPEPLADAELAATPHAGTGPPTLSQPASPRRPRPLSPADADVAQGISERGGSNSTTKVVAERAAYASVRQISPSRGMPAAGPLSAQGADTSDHLSQGGDAVGGALSRTTAKEEAGRRAKRLRDELEAGQNALTRRRPRLSVRDGQHLSPSHRPRGEGLGLFRSVSPSLPAEDSTTRPDATNNHRNDATREESILSQDLQQASPDPSDSDEGSEIRPGGAWDETQEASADEDEGMEVEEADPDVSGSKGAPINASQDDKMHFASGGATAAEAISSSVSPDRLLPTRTDRADPTADISPPSTAAAVAIVQDLGEILVDSAQLAGSLSPSTAAKSPHHSPPKRPQKVTPWRIKPELFDFGLWCRANEITV